MIAAGTKLKAWTRGFPWAKAHYFVFSNYLLWMSVILRRQREWCEIVIIWRDDGAGCETGVVSEGRHGERLQENCLFWGKLWGKSIGLKVAEIRGKKERRDKRKREKEKRKREREGGRERERKGWTGFCCVLYIKCNALDFPPKRFFQVVAFVRAEGTKEI